MRKDLDVRCKNALALHAHSTFILNLFLKYENLLTP